MSTTPGPWFTSLVALSGDVTVRSEQGNRPVARVRVNDRGCLHDDPLAVTQADARLIAAAPDLLAELIRCADEIEHYGEPEGLTNCERNGWPAPVTDRQVAEWEPSRLEKPCTCGAEEQFLRIRAVVGKAMGIGSSNATFTPERGTDGN